MKIGASTSNMKCTAVTVAINGFIARNMKYTEVKSCSQGKSYQLVIHISETKHF